MDQWDMSGLKRGLVTSEITAQKDHNFLFYRWITHKFLQEFLGVVFSIVVIASLHEPSDF